MDLYHHVALLQLAEMSPLSEKGKQTYILGNHQYLKHDIMRTVNWAVRQLSRSILIENNVKEPHLFVLPMACHLVGIDITNSLYRGCQENKKCARVKIECNK